MAKAPAVVAAAVVAVAAARPVTPTSEDNADEGDDSDDDQTEEDADDDQSGESDDETEGSGTSSRRRRRRRRRKGEDAATAPDDPDETVVRVREPRSKTPTNEITAVEGSTRLEAKKQRRREGRAAGRRRAPIVTEAEFLARRESVERTMVIRAREDLTQIAVSEDNVLVEHYVAQAEQSSLIGNVYLGRVQNVLPSMEAAFIDIGKGRNAVLYAGEVDWATLGGANGPRKIESVLKSGQAVLVQVTKDPIGHKGARLTNQISLPGRYVVYVPRGGNGGISRKLPDTERNRLKTHPQGHRPRRGRRDRPDRGRGRDRGRADRRRQPPAVVLDRDRQEVEVRPGARSCCTVSPTC